MFNTKNKKIEEICSGKILEECETELNNHLNKGVYNSNLIKDFPGLIQIAWDKIEKDFFRRLEKVMGEKIVFDSVKGYLTTIFRAPYNPNLKNPSFMFCIHNSVLNILKSCGHEIMHIQFHNSKYWEMVISKIGKKNTYALKEALTVLLNLEFKDLWIVEDGGYPAHKELRDFIELKWKENPNFKDLIDSCIKKLSN